MDVEPTGLQRGSSPPRGKLIRMTTKKALFLDVKDLRYVSITCGKCSTRVVVDMESEPARAGGQTGQVMPSVCPSCHADFDSALKRLNGWREVYAGLKDVNGVQIQVDLDGDATNQ
jgi:hypothetical protein